MNQKDADVSLNQENGLALLPFLVFIVIYLGAGLIMQSRGVEMAFYQFPSVVAISIAVLVAFLINKGSINEKFSIFAKGAGDEGIMTMLMIFLLAGAFSSTAGAMGGVDATVNLGLSLIPARFVTAGSLYHLLFPCGCHRHFDGNDRRDRLHCDGRFGESRAESHDGDRSLRRRRDVRRQPFDDFGYHHFRNPHPGLRAAG